MELSLKLEVYDGPLDLLLSLVEKNKINIYDIPISLITEQYLDYIKQMEKADMSISSEFLLMAATLLSIKSKMLLPSDDKADGEEEEDPRTEIVNALLEYKMYKYISENLKDKQYDADLVMFKEQSLPDEVKEYEQPLNYEELIGDVTLNKLNEIFNEIIKRQKNRRDPIRAGFSKIKKEDISVEQKIFSLRDSLKLKKKLSIRAVLEGNRSREDLIVTFLAILELMKLNEVKVSQDNLFDDIIVEAA